MKKQQANFRLNALAVACAMAVPAATVSLQAGAQSLEEVIVTARHKEETLMDVPLTVAALGPQELENAGINALTDVGRLVPNLQINGAGSGSGSAIYLRGIGSSTISAAFDPAVALNMDGVVTSAARLIQSGQLDIRQIEVLKGPQSLYFGKSASAGVISVFSNDPTDEFEFQVRADYEPEHDETRGQIIVSGAVTDTFGARLAVASTEANEVTENKSYSADPADMASFYNPAKNEYRGNERTDARLTLLWAPTEDLTLRLKQTYSKYEDDGPNFAGELICPEAGNVSQRTVHPFSGVIYPRAADDCDLNETVGMPDVPDELMPASTYSTFSDWNNGVPYVDQEVNMTAFQINWDISEHYILTSITGYVDLENDFVDIFDYSQGLGASHAYNSYESWSQEFRLDTDFDGNWNFSAGAYYGDIEQEFSTGQNAFNVGLLVGPDLDPAGDQTGNGYDWDKVHNTDTESWSAFVATYWNITESLELTAGIRYSDDEKDGKIKIPYMHQFLVGAVGFLPSGTEVNDLEFSDDNWSPEVSLSWNYTDDITFYAAYKEGYKSGGIDNSALPSGSLTGPDFSSLYYDSETGAGGEVGMKGMFLDGTLRVNTAIFYYDYDDLQVQTFDSNVIQYDTSNAGELNTQGFEVDAIWNTSVEGLSLRMAYAYTDAGYEDTFINADGEDLDGEDRERNAENAGYVGFTYDRDLFDGWQMTLSSDARFSDEYMLNASLDPQMQDSYWQYDASIRIRSPEEHWEFAVLGTNLGDEVVASASQSRPFGCAGADGAPCSAVSNDQLDQIQTTLAGRAYRIQLTYNY